MKNLAKTFCKYLQVVFLAVICAFATQAAQAQTADSGLAQRLNHEIICPCPDCGKQAIDQCAPGCADGKKYREEVAAQLEQGADEKGVLKYFQKTYGAASLASPPQEGFGITSKWLPLGALLLGALPLWAMTRNKNRQKSLRRKEPVKPSHDEKADDSLEDALRDFDY